MNEYDNTYADPAQFHENIGGEIPFGTGGIGVELGAEGHIDGTPLRLVTIIVGGILVLVLLHQGGFRYHVTV